VWTIELADRNLVGNDAAESLAGKPAMEVKRRRFDLERWLAQLIEVEIDGMVGRGADRGRHARKYRERGAMNVTGRDQPHGRMALHDRGKIAGIEQVLAVHMPDAGPERRMMQE
jgi:hypothetical protein